MAWYRWEPCREPIIRNANYWQVHLLHLPDRTGGKSNTVPHGGNTHFFTKCRIATLVWYPIQRPREKFEKYKSVFLLCNIPKDDKTVYAGGLHCYVSNPGLTADRVQQQCDVTAPPENCPKDNGHLPGTTLWVLHRKALFEENSFEQKLDFEVLVSGS